MFETIVKIRVFKFNRINDEDYSVLVEDNQGNRFLIRDISEVLQGEDLTGPTYDSFDLDDLKKVLTKKNVEKIIADLNIVRVEKYPNALISAE